MTFAAITTALAIGGFAERMKFSAVVLFAILWLHDRLYPDRSLGLVQPWPERSRHG